MKLSKNQLRQKVISRIYENHNGSITGPVLQEILLDFIDSLKEDKEQGEQAEFIVSSLNLSTTQVNAGDSFNAAITVQNIGGGQGSEVMSLELAWMPFTIPTLPTMPTLSDINTSASLSSAEKAFLSTNLLEKSAISDLSSLIRPVKRIIWTKSVNVTNISAGGNFTITESVPTDDATPGQYIFTVKIGSKTKQASLTIVSEKRYVVSGTVSAALTKRVEKISNDFTIASSRSLTDTLTASSAFNLGSIGNVGSTVIPQLSNPISGVKVSLKGATYLSTYTDKEGNYILETDKPIGDKTLVFTKTGYYIKELAINNRSVVNAALIKKAIITLPDDINDKFEVLDDILKRDKDVIDTDVTLKDNFDKTKTFLDDLNSKVNLKGSDLESGTLNNELSTKVKAIIDGTIAEVQNITNEIATNGSTPELEKRKQANLDLINTGVTTYLTTLSETSKDIAANSNTYAYINTELKNNISAINSSDAAAIISNINAIAEDVVDQPNLNKLLTGMIR